MTKVTFRLKSAGYCTAQESHAVRGGSRRDIKFHATYAHIEHPVHGHILFDTGYTRRFYELTQILPFKIYAKATKVYINEKEEAHQVLKSEGIDATDIKYIIVSHFHADHVGGLRDFPNAQFICAEEAYRDIEHRRGLSALTKGFIPGLLPDDFADRSRFLSFAKAQKENKHLGKTIDLFDDGSILICQLDGHAKGQIGAILNSEQPVFLVSDGAWLKQNYEQLHLPSPIVRLFFDSWSDYKDSLHKIHQYHKAHPDTLIIPCHCEETFIKYRSQ